TPLFPMGSLTPQSLCGHKGPIAQGSIICCMVCHASGYDDHPDLQIEPEEAPTRMPDALDLASTTSKGATKPRETRKERRRKLFESIAAVKAAVAANQPETGKSS